MVTKGWEFRKVCLASLPVAAICFLDGVIFGFLARSYQLGSGEATSMSALVTSGAAQFLLLPYWNQTSVGLLLLLTAGTAGVLSLIVTAMLAARKKSLSVSSLCGFLLFLLLRSVL